MNICVIGNKVFFRGEENPLEFRLKILFILILIYIINNHINAPQHSVGGEHGLGAKSDRNSLKIDSFQEVITSKLINSS